MSFKLRLVSALLFVGIGLAAASAQAALQQRFSMKMGLYVALGPVKDSTHPSLKFPVVDLFSPEGDFLLQSSSVEEVLSFLARDAAKGAPRQPAESYFQSDTLATLAERYPVLKGKAPLFLGRYTVLLVGAPQCKACELQEDPAKVSLLQQKGINQLFLALEL